MQYPPNPPHEQPPQQPQYPSGSYGQPQPPSQPMQYPSSPYGQPQQQFTPAPSAPAGGAHRLRTILVVALIAGILVLLGASAFLHYSGPTRTSQAFVEDVLSHFDGHGAYGLLCDDAKAKLSEDQLQQAINLTKSVGGSWDLSQVTYTLVDEAFFGTAHVRMGGNATVSVAGQSQTVKFNQPGSDTFTLRSSGVGWCLTENSFNPTGAFGVIQQDW